MTKNVSKIARLESRLEKLMYDYLCEIGNSHALGDSSKIYIATNADASCIVEAKLSVSKTLNSCQNNIDSFKLS